MSAEIGIYGKLPAHGDFVGRHFSNEFIQVWDDWLQRCLATSQDQMAEHWLDIYLTSPIWRFVLSPGIIDSQAWVGIMMPSVDQVGRYFPLTFALPISGDVSSHVIMARGNEWFSQIERVALAALDEALNVDVVDERLAECDRPRWPRVQVAQDLRFPWVSKLANEAMTPSASYPYLMDAYVKQQFPTHSLWWTQGSERVPPSFLTAPGLPMASSFAALMDGHWEHWQWYSPSQVVSE